MAAPQSSVLEPQIQSAMPPPVMEVSKSVII